MRGTPDLASLIAYSKSRTVDSFDALLIENLATGATQAKAAQALGMTPAGARQRLKRIRDKIAGRRARRTDGGTATLEWVPLDKWAKKEMEVGFPGVQLVEPGERVEPAFGYGPPEKTWLVQVGFDAGVAPAVSRAEARRWRERGWWDEEEELRMRTKPLRAAQASEDQRRRGTSSSRHL